ncbi:MAG: ankyrin repeat domain-containing protein, partial [Nannocystaceae bacterium]|nr:ankyrin repeat domain-containing protein [Nannocystaceae bacterium]
METREKELIDSAGAGDLDTVKALLDQGTDPNATTGMNSAIAAAAWKNHSEVVQVLLDNGAHAHNGVERSSSLAVYNQLAHEPRSARQAQAALAHIAGWASHCQHEFSDLIATLLEDGAVVNRTVIMEALSQADRSARFFEALAAAGGPLDVLWSELPKNRKKNVPVRKTIQDRRIPELDALIKEHSVPTAKIADKTLLAAIGKEPSEAIPIGDERWRTCLLYTS